MNSETTAFFCHSCHAKGNAVHFTMMILGVSQLEAIRMLKARYSPAGINPDARSMQEEIRKILHTPKPEPKTNQILDEALLEPMAVDWQRAHDAYEIGLGVPATDYMFERGFTPEILVDWQFGYDEISDRIVLPVRDEDGALVGFKARAYDDRKPKYLNLGGSRYGFWPFLKSHIVFGLDRARKISTDLIVVEGELNAVAMAQHGFLNTVAINGSHYGDRQLRLLCRFADSVTLFFDSDPAGYDATRALMGDLEKFIKVKVVPDHDSDPAEMGLDEITACLGEAISSTELRLLGRVRSNASTAKKYLHNA